MTAELRELLRRQIVRCCSQARGNGVTLEMLVQLCRTPAGRPALADVKDEVEYLVGKGLVEKVDKRISPEIGAWKITSDGRDFAAQEGLDE